MHNYHEEFQFNRYFWIVSQVITDDFIIVMVTSFMISGRNVLWIHCTFVHIGDNPATFVCLCGSPNSIVLSMGSSDTLLFWTPRHKMRLLQGHLMVNPLDVTRLMGMLCFKNGSLMRDNLVDELAGGEQMSAHSVYTFRLWRISTNLHRTQRVFIWICWLFGKFLFNYILFSGDWSRFDEMLNSTQPGNEGKVGVYYDFPEILPERQGRYRFDLSGDEPVSVERFTPEEDVRALIEG